MTRGEVWFDDEPDGSRVDWIHYMQRPSPVPRSHWKIFHTRLVDLRQTTDQLFAELDGKTARKILDAEEKEKMQCERGDARDSTLMDRIEEMWNQFATAQNTPPLDRPWFNQIIQAGALDIVAARDQAGNVLAYHLVYLTPKRARQLIAISPYKPVPTVVWRNAVSRANCVLHWKNFQLFKQQGIACFDFGGWYPGKTDMRLLAFNAFKKGFGGKICQEYECEQPVSLKGWVLLNASRILNHFRHPAPASPAAPEPNNDAQPLQDHKISPALR